MAEEEASGATEIALQIKELGDKLADLTIKQAVDLKDYMKDAYGIEPAAGVAVAAPGVGAAEEEEKEEQVAFDVILTGFGSQKIKVIKVVREVTSLGLKEAKALVDSAPAPIKEGIMKEQADELVAKIKEVGGEVEIK